MAVHVYGSVVYKSFNNRQSKTRSAYLHFVRFHRAGKGLEHGIHELSAHADTIISALKQIEDLTAVIGCLFLCREGNAAPFRCEFNSIYDYIR